MNIISVYLSIMSFWCVKETFLFTPKTYDFIDKYSRSSYLNPVCPKFILNKRLFLKISIQIFEFLLYIQGTHLLTDSLLYKWDYILTLNLNCHAV